MKHFYRVTWFELWYDRAGFRLPTFCAGRKCETCPLRKKEAPEGIEKIPSRV